MKRIVLIIVATTLSVSLFAQNKGDKYIAGIIGASFGGSFSEVCDGTFTEKESAPSTTSLGLHGELGYFVADNVRLALALGLPYSSTPYSKSGNDWLYSNIMTLSINPNIAYYFKLTDNLYYTPEIGGDYEIGKYKQEMTKTVSLSEKASGWTVYAKILAFEFQLSKSFALGFGAGSIRYEYARMYDNDSDGYIGAGKYSFSLNSGSISAHFYL